MSDIIKRTVYTSKNNESLANITYTKRITIPLEYDNIEFKVSDSTGTTKSILVSNNSALILNGKVELSNGYLNYSINPSEEIDEEINQETEVIVDFSYTFVPVEKIHLINNIELKHRDEIQKIEIPVTSVVGTSNALYGNYYYTNLNLDSLAIGGTYYDIEYAEHNEES